LFSKKGGERCFSNLSSDCGKGIILAAERKFINLLRKAKNNFQIKRKFKITKILFKKLKIENRYFKNYKNELLL
jgi:hypothetical protein